MSDIPDPYPDDRKPSCETHGLHSPCVHDFPTDSGMTIPEDAIEQAVAIVDDGKALVRETEAYLREVAR